MTNAQIRTQECYEFLKEKFADEDSINLTENDYLDYEEEIKIIEDLGCVKFNRYLNQWNITKMRAFERFPDKFQDKLNQEKYQLTGTTNYEINVESGGIAVAGDVTHSSISVDNSTNNIGQAIISCTIFSRSMLYYNKEERGVSNGSTDNKIHR